MTKLRSHTLEVLTLSLDGHAFAIPASCVREILDVVPVTEVPGASPFVSGLINVRGRVVPFADLRHKFGMPITPPSIDTRIVVIEVDLDGDPTMIGIVAEKVHEVTELAAAAIEDAPRIGLTWRREYIDCIAKLNGDFVVVLDIEAIFASHRRLRRDVGADASAGRTAA